MTRTFTASLDQWTAINAAFAARDGRYVAIIGKMIEDNRRYDWPITIGFNGTWEGCALIAAMLGEEE